MNSRDLVRKLLEGYDDLHPSEIISSVPGPVPRIVITYGLVTPESAADGDYAETGFEDEEGNPVVPDEWDIEEGLGVPEIAARYLKHKGATQESSSHFHVGVWYSDDGEENYRDGSRRYRSYHLKDFKPEDEKKVFMLMTGKTDPRWMR